MIVRLRVIVHQPKLTAWRSKNIIILPALAKVDFYLRLGLQAVPLIAAPTCGRKLIKILFTPLPSGSVFAAPGWQHCCLVYLIRFLVSERKLSKLFTPVPSVFPSPLQTLPTDHSDNNQVLPG